jgi:hypothetical protein
MNCWKCDRPAHGICRFCGRAVCKEHAQTLVRIEHLYHTSDERQMALVVPDVLYCGECQPRQDPIELESLK